MIKIKIMLVDDHSVVRMGFRLLLNGSKNTEVVAEADSGEEAVKKYQEIKPDVIVMDISMPGIGGLEATNRILLKDSNAKILILSSHEDLMHASRAMKSGARGYLTKRSVADELLKAIEQIFSDKTYLESNIAQELALQKVSGNEHPIENLSEKEFKVFISLAKGKSVQEIADILSLSPRTVGTHLYNIKQKLKANNSAELTLIALRAGLIEE